ncbi:copper resistance system multicopper oxidase [Alkalimarinus coralli]|uniref:copper resistance system multicopper oxidase n=1 Tax=Alkalimarinus coralli TaxID=2935863 RepID=UPI00202AEE71|nr:copper resistance system multicopper oxidase [Alkalimarinus coralli]
MNTCRQPVLSRRRFVTGLSSATALSILGSTPLLLGSKRYSDAPPVMQGKLFDLNIAYQEMNFTGSPSIATTISGALPAPILRWKEGERVTLRVHNNLDQTTSIHWHGIILPTDMDGVPGLSFGGIPPGESFEYQFDLLQSGTYWYHSHSGFQEQTGMYGAIIIDPIEPEPFSYDRDYVVLLSDWSDESPSNIYNKLKKLSHYYNFRERTLADFFEEADEHGVANAWNNRRMWNQMRMSDRDISDVTGYTYTFLMNGQAPADGWIGLFDRGQKVRLRFINAAAMTFFDVRIPGLRMTVIAADGQNIQPISIDEFRIGVAETYDVIVEPESDTAYTIFAQSIDRTGYARGTLTPHPNLKADIPALDPAPILTHADMGMGGQGAHEGHDMSGSGMPTFKMKGSEMPGAGMMGTGQAGFGSSTPVKHSTTEFGPHVDMRADNPNYRLDDPGVGLRNHLQRYDRTVLTYADLQNLYKTQDTREPQREIQLHLTGNMSRYMWSINGTKFADAEPLHLSYGERVRITLVNDTMMNHPIHLHGMWSELETGDDHYIARKHTVIVQPGAKISYLVTADAIGRWAYHCHLLYHMPGMFREVIVS